jgi:hypothetical protein
MDAHWSALIRPFTCRDHTIRFGQEQLATPLRRELVEFFRTMPLWLDPPEPRVVHARWSPDAMAAIQDHVDREGRLTEGRFMPALNGGTSTYYACAANTLRTACAEENIAGQLPEYPSPLEAALPFDESKSLFLFGIIGCRAVSLTPSRRACLGFSIARGGVLRLPFRWRKRTSSRPIALGLPDVLLQPRFFGERRAAMPGLSIPLALKRGAPNDPQ